MTIIYIDGVPHEAERSNQEFAQEVGILGVVRLSRALDDPDAIDLVIFASIEDIEDVDAFELVEE